MRNIILAAAILLTACVSTPPEGLTRTDMRTISGIEKQVTENWYAMPYIDSAKRSATVKLKLNADGTIADLAISKSSGNTNFDNGLLIAIRQSAPFKVHSAAAAEYGLTFTK